MSAYYTAINANMRIVYSLFTQDISQSLTILLFERQ